MKWENAGQDIVTDERAVENVKTDDQKQHGKRASEWVESVEKKGANACEPFN